MERGVGERSHVAIVTFSSDTTTIDQNMVGGRNHSTEEERQLGWAYLRILGVSVFAFSVESGSCRERKGTVRIDLYSESHDLNLCRSRAHCISLFRHGLSCACSGPVIHCPGPPVPTLPLCTPTPHPTRYSTVTLPFSKEELLVTPQGGVVDSGVGACGYRVVCGGGEEIERI